MNELKTEELEKNARQVEEIHRQKMGRIAQEVEKIFLREDLTMGEMAEVMDLFNSRAHAVFSDTKLKKIRDDYERRP